MYNAAVIIDEGVSFEMMRWPNRDKGSDTRFLRGSGSGKTVQIYRKSDKRIRSWGGGEFLTSHSLALQLRLANGCA